MTIIAKPNLTGYGNSFSTARGSLITQADPLGDIISSSLNMNTVGDEEGGVIEWSNFNQTIRDYILIKLGFPTVRVELENIQLKVLVDEAISKLDYHAPMWTTQYAVFDASADVSLYELPTWVLNNLTYVNYRKSLLAIQAQAGTLEFDFFIKYFQDNYVFSDFSVGQFYLLQMHLEQIRKILGNEGTWDIINNKYLQLQPQPAVTPEPVILEFRAIDSNTIMPIYRNWIQRYALANAKILLGNIRGKFKTLPAPGGGAQLNSEALIAEGQKEKEELEEQLLWEMEQPPMFSTF